MGTPCPLYPTMLSAVVILAFAAFVSAQRDAYVECDTSIDGDKYCVKFEQNFESSSSDVLDHGECFCVESDGSLSNNANSCSGSNTSGKVKVDIDFGFKYNREDRTEDTRGECGPEFVAVIDGEKVASTESEVDSEHKAVFPAEGEGRFDIKVELKAGKHCINLLVRDGEGCDLFDDDDSAEDDRLRQVGSPDTLSDLRKRSVESSSSDDDDDSTLSSSGTTVSLSSLREQQRINAALHDAIYIEIDDSSSSSSSSDDDDDEDRKRALNYFA